MWIRYRKNYGSGPWSHWHETVGTADTDPTRCGARAPAHRLESVERPPEKHHRCGNCMRFRARPAKRTRPVGKR